MQPMVIGEDGKPKIVDDVAEYLHSLEQANLGENKEESD